jgi:hypothetical protein
MGFGKRAFFTGIEQRHFPAFAPHAPQLLWSHEPHVSAYME